MTPTEIVSRSILVIASGCGTIGDSAHADPTAMNQPLDIVYRANGGRMPVEFELHIAPDGHADVFLGTAFSLPTVALSPNVGWFSGPVPTAMLADVTEYVNQHRGDLTSGKYGEWNPDSIGRSLEIAAVDKAGLAKLASITLTGGGKKAVDPVEERLTNIAIEIVKQPKRTIRASLHLERKGDVVLPTIELASVGNEAFTALFAEAPPKTDAMNIQLDVEQQINVKGGMSFATPIANHAVSKDEVVALVAAGTLKTGALKLAPNSKLVFSLKTFTLPKPRPPRDGQMLGPLSVRARIFFWDPSTSPRRSLQAVTPMTVIRDHPVLRDTTLGK